jgi:hypothetical protein
VCDDKCCPGNHECLEGKCCPKGRVCGGTCCKPGESCIQGDNGPECSTTPVSRCESRPESRPEIK